MLGPNPAGVIVKHHIQNPVHRLHAPVTSDAFRELANLRRTAAQKVSNLHSALATFFDLGDRLTDAHRTGPQLGHRLEFSRNLANSIVPLFAAAASLGHRLLALDAMLSQPLSVSPFEVLSDRFGQLGVIVFDREDVVTATAMDLLRDRLLSTDGVTPCLLAQAETK